jgi:preprotein translocase subunit SecG
MSVNLLLIFFVLIVVAMIAFILVQKGAGATAGSAFGSGASSTVFGAKGSGNFLTKTTMVLAFLFFAISLYMAVEASKNFTAATTGEVDLGVIGKLDTEDSGNPEVKAIDPVDQQPITDIPTSDVKTSSATDVPVTEAVNEAVDESSELENKAVELKDDVLKKAEDVIEKVEEAKDKIDG